ncbi:MAG TPA: hypothetical protein VIM65_14725 [Cyclobacteriaceae bacterium]
MNYQFIRGTLFFVALLACNVCMAQNGNELAVPSTPAFSILNYEPAAIMRPTNPKELSADVLNSFDKNGKLLMNVGLEVAPYWLKSRPALTRAEYLNAKGGQAFKQSLMLSMATVKDTITNNNKLGAGFRFRLSGGKVTAEYTAKEQQLISRATMISVVSSARAFIQTPNPALALTTRQEVIEFIRSAFTNAASGLTSQQLEEFQNYAQSLSSNYSDAQADLLAFTAAINTKIDEASDDLKKEVVALSRKRIGLTTEIAGAASFYKTTHEKFEKAGIWFNAANVRSQTDSWNFSVRYLFMGKDSVNSNLDFGGAYIKELSKFSFSIEAMGRVFHGTMHALDAASNNVTYTDNGMTWRLAAQASYKIAQDISVNLSLGKNFDSPFLQDAGFFSIFGVRYSIFKNNKAALPTVP